MLVKTEAGGTFDAAGNGTKGISIAGLVTGATALVGSGLLNVLTGGNKPCHHGENGYDRYVTQKESDYLRQIDALESCLSQQKAERYTDYAVINQAQKDSAAQKSFYEAFIQVGNGLTKLDQQFNCLNEKLALKDKMVEMQFDAMKKEFGGAIALEAERRCCGDQSLYGYVNATFVPGKLIMPADSICPESMPRYNSWTAPTATATTTG
jgi:hypothetical protein